MSMEISSADGWNKISFVPQSRFPANPQFFLAELVITGKFWDRESALFPESTLELTDDFQVELRQVVVLAERMKELAGYLERWLSDFSEFEIRLSEERGPTVVVAVGLCPTSGLAGLLTSKLVVPPQPPILIAISKALVGPAAPLQRLRYKISAVIVKNPKIKGSG